MEPKTQSVRLKRGWFHYRAGDTIQVSPDQATWLLDEAWAVPVNFTKEETTRSKRRIRRVSTPKKVVAKKKPDEAKANKQTPKKPTNKEPKK